MSDWTHKVLAIGVTLGFLGVLAGVLFGFTAPGATHDILLLLLGTLASKWGTIIDWFFGSSSDKK